MRLLIKIGLKLHKLLRNGGGAKKTLGIEDQVTRSTMHVGNIYGTP